MTTHCNDCGKEKEDPDDIHCTRCDWDLMGLNCPVCDERPCECDPTPSDEELEWSAGCSIPTARERQLMGLDRP